MSSFRNFNSKIVPKVDPASWTTRGERSEPSSPGVAFRSGHVSCGENVSISMPFTWLKYQNVHFLYHFMSEDGDYEILVKIHRIMPKKRNWKVLTPNPRL